MNIVLDADGVLLDYNRKMAEIYEKALGKKLEIFQISHHFVTMYGVTFTPDEKNAVYEIFNTQGWNSMPAIQGAVEATQALHAAGHTLSVLSSMPGEFVAARGENFKTLGIPVQKVVGSGRDGSGINPKAIHLEQLKPDIFVDDQLRNFQGIPESIVTVWIDNQYHDSPDIGMDRQTVDFTYHSLEEFAQDMLTNPAIFVKKKVKTHKP